MYRRTPRPWTLFIPNPFNYEVQISYVVSSVGQHVSLDIYNILGQRICTLWDGFKEASTYTNYWDGQDDAGRDVPSGAYICKLDVARSPRTRKVVLPK